MQNLIEGLFLPAFGTPANTAEPDKCDTPRSALAEIHDSAMVDVGQQRIAFTTDSFVVDPLFFPGGDIGKLAVFGTANDLAMAGAKPLAMSAGFILEEGLPMETLQRIVGSMRAAADRVGVRIVTGDTKVVDRGKGDGIFVNTAGIGLVPEGLHVGPSKVQPGDAVLVSGDLGRHGIAIMSVREGLEFEGALDSDCGPLVGLVAALLEAGVRLHCLRDLTRGGVAAALNEIAGQANVGIEIEESAVPIAPPVAGACELLGLDPLYVANEGRLVAFVPSDDVDQALAIMAKHPEASGPAAIGRVVRDRPGVVQLVGGLGGRILDLLSGEQMPRIC